VGRGSGVGDGVGHGVGVGDGEAVGLGEGVGSTGLPVHVERIAPRMPKIAINVSIRNSVFDILHQHDKRTKPLLLRTKPSGSNIVREGEVVTVIKNCLACNKEYLIQRYETNKRKYCGRRCASKVNHTTHGKSKSKVYAVWNAMLSRCGNQKNKSFERYGGRGIKVCQHWMIFENFYKDMGDPPFPAAEIDRINNEKGYEPSNCKWANRTEQMNNTRKTLRITYQGKELGYRQACALVGLTPGTVWSRAERLNTTIQTAFDFSLLYKPSHSNPNNGAKKAFEEFLKDSNQPLIF
jgi:hypothetical protein